ncbi:MAG: hypothetical protein U9R79_09330 [Armatimonadota bacterium]|nr:hypothetical protein [Armatimonadota bacterium]
MSDDDQPRLPMDLPEPVPRPRRRRSRRVRSRRGEQSLALLQPPVLQRCGRCGRRQTVLGDAAVCRHCGALIFRDDENLQ